MKHLIYVTAFLVSCSSPDKDVEQSEFEGTIVYSVTATSKDSSIYGDAEIQGLYGDSLTFYYKSGKYRLSFNGDELSEVYYFTDQNTEYTLLKNMDTLFQSDCSVKLDELVGVEEAANKETILGYSCKQLKVTSNKNSRTYLYSPHLYLDPVNFQDYVSGHLNEYYSRAKAPYLMYIFEGAYFRTVYKAVRINETRLDTAVFDLPDLPLKML